MLELRGVGYRYAGYAYAGPPRDRPDARTTARSSGVVGANEAGKSTLCLVASGLAPGSIGGALSGGGLWIDGQAMAGKPLHEFSTRVGHRVPEPGDAAVRA